MLVQRQRKDRSENHSIKCIKLKTVPFINFKYYVFQKVDDLDG
jgi:hypothetical protein